jgi:heme-degrading monooxygenase HmoA
VIASVHLAATGTRRALRAYFHSAPDPATVAGLTYAETVLTAPLSAGVLPKPTLGEVGLIASWESDEDLDRFLADPALAGPFASGWHVRMRPVRVFGAWPAMPGLPEREIPVDEDEPVVVLTLGRPRFTRLHTFLPTSARAEAELDGASGLLAATGLAHPPRLVSTFSVWESAAAMRAYAHYAASAHTAAVRADRATRFHHESAFVRLRPYRTAGTWSGRDPLEGLTRSESPAVP